MARAGCPGVASQVSRWKRATHHLVPGKRRKKKKRERERERELSPPAQLVGFWPTAALNLHQPYRPPFSSPSAVTFRSATQRWPRLKQEGARLPSRQSRGWEDDGRAGEREHSGKQKHLLSCICLSLASHGAWQLEMLVVHTAIPRHGCWVIPDGRHFFFPAPSLLVSVSLSLSLPLSPSISIAPLPSPPPISEGQPLRCDFEQWERTIGLTAQWHGLYNKSGQSFRGLQNDANAKVPSTCVPTNVQLVAKRNLNVCKLMRKWPYL